MLVVIVVVIAVTILVLLVVSLAMRQLPQHAGKLEGVPGSSQSYVVPLRTHKTSARVQFGNTPGKYTLLIGSCPLDQRMWDPVLNALQQSLTADGKKLFDYTTADTVVDIPTIITYDSRGCGTADYPIASNNEGELQPTLEDYSSDIDDLLTWLDLQSTISIAGWGFGGIVAQHYALTRPDRVTGLFVFSSGSTDRTVDNGKLSVDSLVINLTAYRELHPDITYLTPPEPLVKRLLDSWFSKDSKETDVYERIQDSLRELNVDQYLQTLRIVQSQLESSGELAKLWRSAKSVPFSVYLMSASDDPLATPLGATQLFALMKRATDNKAVMDVKQGLHGYSLVHADETARELTVV